MSDCTNVEIRELLPDYLHARVSGADRGRVEAHLASCEDCAAELSVLGNVRQAYRRVPPVDTDAIVRALPRRARVRSRPVRRVTLLQIAAAISFVSIGGISLVVARSFFDGEPPVVQVDSAVRPAVDSGTQGVGPGVASTPVRGLTFGGGVSDLAAEDLEVLLSAIESLEVALPPEPDDSPQSGNGRAGSGTS
jgi:anti-sigma factor RsiW